MNWLTNFVRPKLRQLVGQKEAPENLWQKCTGCGQMIFHRDVEKNLHVCQHCGHHLRMTAARRLEMLFDEGKFDIIETPNSVSDPLKFRDSKKYTDRLKDARGRTGSYDALLVGVGELGAIPVVVAALDFGFMGGSMGIAVGEGLIAAAILAVERQAPLVVVSSSGGARMQEGALSLMQLARTTIAVDEVRDAGLPYVVILADPTTGGVSASFAMLGDVTIAEPGAIIGFAGARVIEQTIRETLPDGFQKAEYLLDHGMVDMVVRRHDLRETLARVLALLLKRQPAAVVREVPLLAPADMAEAADSATPDAVSPAPEAPVPGEERDPE